MSTFNPNVLPSKSQGKKNEPLTAGVVACVIVVIIGLIYWSQRPAPKEVPVVAPTPDAHSQARASVVSALIKPTDSAPVQQQTKSVVTSLRPQSKTKSTATSTTARTSVLGALSQ